MNTYKYLITGAHGQIGKGLIPQLIKQFGKDCLLATDIAKTTDLNCSYETLDVRDKEKFNHLIKSHNINYIVHLAGILSALGEKNPQLAKEVNIDAVFNVFDLANSHKTKLFIPSTIATYGGRYNKIRASPDIKTYPSTIYGVAKIMMENLGEYHRTKNDLDFRCIRYTAVVSPFEYAYNGSAYYATEIFFKAVREGKYTVNVAENRRLPLCHLDDIVEGTVKYLTAPRENLTRSMYTIHGLDFTPKELSDEIRKYVPGFKERYDPQIQDVIAATWPESLDDSAAKKDWGWNPKYNNIEKLVKDMIICAKESNKQ